MAYATRTDMETLRGASFVETLVPRDVDTAAAIAAALNAASGRIDAYLAKRYTLPLATPPEILRTSAIDIACYELACDHGRLTEDIEKRHDRAIRFLKDVGTGAAALGSGEPHAGGLGPAPGQTGISSDDAASFSARPRNFGRGRPAP